MAEKSYKCPNCGAGLEFKPAHQKFRCDYCLSEYSEKEILDKDKDHIETNEVDKSLVEQDHLASYNCNSCGATVVTDDTTTSTFCYYCHNPVILSDRLIGSFQPNKMIPFTVDKDQAQKTFLNWVSKNRFVSSDFYSSSQLEKITGVYLPYWWADSKIDVDYEGEKNTSKVWTNGDTEYTETNKYRVIRQGQIEISNIEEVAFSKIEKDLLDGIAPYNQKKVRDFSMPYLSGFFAEQYDISKEEVTHKIDNQIKKISNILISNTILDNNQMKVLKDQNNIVSKKMSYTLLPAWILTYQYEGKTFVFAVNGQTGKSFGELPISNKKILGTAVGVFVVTTLVLLLGGMFIW